MSELDLDRELSVIKERYGDSRRDAGNRYEQELGKLFVRSGWTIEELAAKAGKSKSSVAYSLTFGRFLNFSTMVENIQIDLSTLSERRFREAWNQTDKQPNERARFQAVLDILTNEDTQAVKKRKIAIRKEMIATFGDGKWHPVEKLIGHFADDEPEDVQQIIDRLGWESSKHLCTMERKPVGKSFKVRIFKNTEKNISVTRLMEELSPLIEELSIEGKKSSVRISPPSVALIATRLRKLLDRWCEE